MKTVGAVVQSWLPKITEAENDSNFDHVHHTFWVPKVATKVLEDSRVQKAAIAGDYWLDLLFEHHGIQCESIHEFSVSSLAIAGYGRVDDSQNLSTLTELTEEWMRQEARAISWEEIWPKKHLLVEKWLGGDDKEVALGVLSAYATFCVREKLCDAARMKRRNNPGAVNGLHVFSTRM
ncbi:hypothetical protein BWQ96_04631 [Gracilariopsis chorda]|uniref:Uncharacterized protein n=1 Tax=Gracilariopsis chorda TaxID=448386 RepID=A0A2V3IU14_9FLOR|nr:hypothetical protein BWQ96_04631 [Gracilariopsis chorda]|eukprot:PXF45626.1 hypothetical protein BWQ96_04631 [Gracilariopsis chorda]